MPKKSDTSKSTQDSSKPQNRKKGIVLEDPQKEIKDLTENKGICIIRNIESYVDDLNEYMIRQQAKHTKHIIHFDPYLWSLVTESFVSKRKAQPKKLETLQNFWWYYIDKIDDNKTRESLLELAESSGWKVSDKAIYSIGLNRNIAHCQKYEASCLNTKCEYCTIKSD